MASAAYGQGHGGNTVGGNGDRVTGWFTSLGFELLTELERAEKNGQMVMPECPAAEFKQALATQIVLVDATNAAMLTNQFGEIKDIKVVWHAENKTFLILLDRALWTKAYNRKEADYRMVLHTYVLAAGKRDRNYLVTRQVNIPRLMAPRPATFERRTSLVWVQPASDGGFIGVGNAITVSAVLTKDPKQPFRPYFLPHDHLVKLNAAGEEEWRQELIAHIRFILPTDDGGYLILGLKRKDPGDPTESPGGRPRREVDKAIRDRNAFAFAVKLNRGGEAEWKRSYCTYETSDGACAEVNLGAFEKPNGNYVILSANSIHEMDPSGAVDGRKIQLVETHRPLAVEPLREGGAIVAGMKNRNVPYAMQFKADGHILWERELAFPGEPGTIVPTKGGFLLGGTRRLENGNEGSEPILMKLGVVGEELWRKTIAAPTELGKPLLAEVPGVPDPKNPNDKFVYSLSPVLAGKPGGLVRSIVPLPSGGLIAAVGHTVKGEERWSLKELSSLGDTLWDRPVGKDPVGMMAYPGDGGLVVPQGGRLLKIRTTLKKGKIDF